MVESCWINDIIFKFNTERDTNVGGHGTRSQARAEASVNDRGNLPFEFLGCVRWLISGIWGQTPDQSQDWPEASRQATSGRNEHIRNRCIIMFLHPGGSIWLHPYARNQEVSSTAIFAGFCSCLRHMKLSISSSAGFILWEKTQLLPRPSHPTPLWVNPPYAQQNLWVGPLILMIKLFRGSTPPIFAFPG